MTNIQREYIEIMVTPSGTLDKSLDALELCLCKCLYLGFKLIVVNFELTKKYDIMLVQPMFDLLIGLKEIGASFIITNPPLVFSNEFSELYTESTIPLIANRDQIISEDRDIIHTFLEDDPVLEDALKDENRTRYARQQEEIEANKPPKQIIEAEVIDSDTGFSYFDPEKNIEVCTITGEYICSGCGTKEYFMKGFPFDPCESPKCNKSRVEWDISKKVF